MLRARYPTARPDWLRNFFGTGFRRRLLAERIRLGSRERELGAEGDALAGLTNPRLPEKKIGTEALWHSRPAKTPRGFVACAQFSRLSIAKKSRRNRFRNPALQNPKVFLSDRIMTAQNHLSMSVWRNSKDERTASLPERVPRVSSMTPRSTPKSVLARERPAPSGTIRA